MRTVLVTGSDTGVGKTWVVTEIARALAARGAKVQVVKVVETGVEPGARGDAARAAAGLEGVEAVTLFAYKAALAPASAAKLEGRSVAWSEVLGALRALRQVAWKEAEADRVPGAGQKGAAKGEAESWRILEGAGGIASPIDEVGHDWADLAAEMRVERAVIVVPERLGAINQARLCVAHAERAGVHAGVWLNRMQEVDADVSASTKEMLQNLGIPLWGLEEVGGARPLADPGRSRGAGPLAAPDGCELAPTPVSAPGGIVGALVRDQNAVGPSALGDRAPPPLTMRLEEALGERDRLNQRRRVRVTPPAEPDTLNLADNDYLDLAHDPAVLAAASAAAARYGTSASASPLITGWKEPHQALLDTLCPWHGFPCGLLWTSGYAANCAVLGTLPEKGDLILADRLIHHSMIAGLARSGARFKRYPHLDLDRLELALGGARPLADPERSRGAGALGPTSFGAGTRTMPSAPGGSAPPPPAGTPGLVDRGTTFVVTESIFSMDGDYPDLARLAALKRDYNFFLILDEAHALGWYGTAGAGLAATAGAAGSVDVFVGTLGKTLASGGAYTLFRDEAVRDTLINRAGEFIYSTAIPPAAAAAAAAAIGRVQELAPEQSAWQAQSRAFRAQLRAAGWKAPDGDSPIVPVVLDEETAALNLAGALQREGIWAAAVRPPTVPAGTSRLRFSLKRGFGPAEAERVLSALARWRSRW